MKYQHRVLGMLSLLALSDALVRRWGLKAGRRTVGVVDLSLAYAGILLQQPNLCAVCLDTGRSHAGAVFGFMNTASQVASSVSSIAFGYIVGYTVGYTGNYNLPFIPMVVTLSIGAVLWLRMDPTHQVFETRESLAA